MKRKDVIVLLLVSFVLTNILAYLDYDSGNFDYFIEKWTVVLIMTLIFAILPIVLLLILRKRKYKLYFSLFGFLPVLYLIFYLL